MRIHNVHTCTIILQLPYNVNHLGVPDIRDILLKRDAHNQHPRRHHIAPQTDQVLDNLLTDIATHRVIHKTTGVNNLRVVFELVRLIHQVIRINTYAVSAYQTRIKFEKIPFSAGCLKYIISINSKFQSYTSNCANMG